jgi:hypothetical protein
MFGKPFSDLKMYDLDEDLCLAKETYSALNETARNLYLVKSLEKKLDFIVDSFYHARVSKETTEIKLSFSSINQQSLNAQRFLNHLSLHVFGSASVDKSNADSIKLTVLTSEIKNFFHQINLNFTGFYLNYNQYEKGLNSTVNNFFVTNKKCHFNRLHNSLESSKLKVAFLFNMNLYDSTCSYYEKKSQTFYMTVSGNNFVGAI